MRTSLSDCLSRTNAGLSYLVFVQRAEGIGREVTAQKVPNGILLPREQRRYLTAMQNALAALDDARHVLACVVERVEVP